MRPSSETGAQPPMAEVRRRLADRLSAGVSRFQPGDREQLREFLRRQYGAQCYQADARFFGWRFLDHPDRPVEGPPIWLCRREGRIVGHQAALPLALTLDGRPLSAAWAIDLMVDPEWRLRGVAPAVTSQLYDDRVVTAGLGIALAARRAFARAGWLDLGRIPHYVRLLRPLRAGQAPTGRRPVSRAVALTSWLGTPLLALMAGMDAAMLAAARLAGLRLEPVERFDARVDAVWQAVAPEHPLIARRDQAALTWRFDAAPDAAVYRRYYLMRENRVVGYAVLRRRRDSLMVVDHLCLPRWQWALFAHCLAAARRDRATALLCLATRPALQSSLRKLGFLPHPGPHFMVYVNPGAALRRDVVGNAANWFLTEADSDLDHTPIP